MVDSIQAPSTAQVHTELGIGTMDAASAGFWQSARTLLLASKRYSEEFFRRRILNWRPRTSKSHSCKDCKYDQGDNSLIWGTCSKTKKI